MSLGGLRPILPPCDGYLISLDCVGQLLLTHATCSTCVCQLVSFHLTLLTFRGHICQSICSHIISPATAGCPRYCSRLLYKTMLEMSNAIANSISTTTIHLALQQLLDDYLSERAEGQQD